MILDYAYTRDELAFLARNDADPFNRWDAMNRLMLGVLEDMTDVIEMGGKPG